MAVHGVFAEERRGRQRFVVDAEWWLDAEAAARSDEYKGAVCYRDVFETVLEIFSGPPRSLIEALAVAVADAILDRFEPIRAVAITVHKPQAPLPGKFSDVGVSVTRQRRRQ